MSAVSCRRVGTDYARGDCKYLSDSLRGLRASQDAAPIDRFRDRDAVTAQHDGRSVARDTLRSVRNGDREPGENLRTGEAIGHALLPARREQHGQSATAVLEASLDLQFLAARMESAEPGVPARVPHVAMARGSQLFGEDLRSQRKTLSPSDIRTAAAMPFASGPGHGEVGFSPPLPSSRISRHLFPRKSG